MAKRGRPKHPDILTPREWEVLSLIRQGYNNPQIAERLGIGVEGVKYHVSEILSKLGVVSREDAALWRPTSRPWWAGVVAPFSFVWRKAGSGPAVAAGATTVALVVIAGLGLLVWGLLRTGGGGTSPAEAATALVHIGGTIDSISIQKLVLKDYEGHLVSIRLEHAEGPEAYFCDHRTPIPLCMVLSEAAPTAGENVCVLAHLTPPEDFLAWFVMLDSRCEQVPAPTAVSTP